MSPNLAGFPPRYLRTPEAARFVGLSIRTLEKHRIYGTGPRYSKLGGRVVYRLEDLQAWVELGAKASTSDPGVPFGVGHQLPRKCMEVGHLRRVLWRHGEPKMMPIVFAPLGEGLRVGVLRVCVEHTCVRAVAGDALALEIGDVLCERRGAEPLALVPNDPGHDDDAPTRRAG